MEQQIIFTNNSFEEFDEWLQDNSINSFLLVCDSSITFLNEIRNHLLLIEKKGIRIITFDRFQPNPLYSSVVEGVKVFRNNKCDAIVAVGGGSAIDVAKCIKLYSNTESDGDAGGFLNINIIPNKIPFLVIPTTAGTGSESTRYAVIYYNGKKQSITNNSVIPNIVLMDSNVLKTLPLYQKKSTMMDAFCHALESFWSINSTIESRKYSKNAIRLILHNMEGYLSNTDEGNRGMLLAANTAGKAINITQTTAGHAMCYKITSLFGVAHGHAAILCDRVLFPWMIDHLDNCIDSRGKEYLNDVFLEIAEAMNCNSAIEAAKQINEIFEYLDLEVPVADIKQFEELSDSVNLDRLKNHPISMDARSINSLYHSILNTQ